jgi:hypothetical protein
VFIQELFWGKFPPKVVKFPQKSSQKNIFI